MRSKAWIPACFAALAALVALHLPSRGPQAAERPRASASASQTAPEADAPRTASASDERAAPTVGALEVLVLRADDRAPLGELALTLRPLDDGAFEARLAYTDHHGLARFDDVPSGDVVVESAVGGELDAVVRSKTCGRRTLLVARGVDVRGRVLAPDGTPIAGAKLVLARSADLDDPRHAWPVVISDPYGRFALADVAPGARRLVARHPDFAPSTAHALAGEPGATHELDVVLGWPAAELRGRVLDEYGKLLEDARITVGRVGGADAVGDDASVELPVASLATRTAARGEFVLRGLPVGESWIEARATGHVATTQRRVLSPGANERIELVLSHGVRLSGVARLAHGAPARHALVRATGRDGEERTACAALDGSFVLEALPRGRVHVAVDWQGEQWAETELELGGDEARWEPQLEPVRSLRGTVVDSRGEPIADATVWLGLADGDRNPHARLARTAADGSFRFGGLAEREYSLGVFADAEQLCELARRERVRPSAGGGSVASARELEIVVDAQRRPSATLVGRVLGPDSRAVVGAKVRARRAGLELSPRETDEDGAFECGPLAPGEWTLLVEPPATAEHASRGSSPANDPARAPTNVALAPRALFVDGLAPGEVRDVGDVSLARGARITVRCERSGELAGADAPVLGTPVVVARSLDTSLVEWLELEGGVARSRPLPSGRWRVALEAGAGLALAAAEVELDDADVELALELRQGSDVVFRFDDDVRDLRLVAEGGRVLLERGLGDARELELVLAPGRYCAEPRAADGRTHALEFEVISGSPRRVLDVKME